jgi:hypothetical protein
MKEIKYIILYLVPVPAIVINYGSGSDFLTSYGSGSTSQKVTVPTVPVPQCCLQDGRNQAYKPSPVVQLVCAKDVRQSWPKNYTTDPVIEQGRKRVIPYC